METSTDDPIIVECKLCGEQISLAKDTPDARATGVDPSQQLRKHLRDNHSTVDRLQLGHWSGWVVDRLAFKGVTNQERWKSSAHELLDHFLEAPIKGKKT